MTTTTYPNAAGYQPADTSREAAKQLDAKDRTRTLNNRVLELMEQLPEGLTADAAAHHLNEDVLSIRPRFTQLKQIGLLVYRGERRKSRMGVLQRVLIHRYFDND